MREIKIKYSMDGDSINVYILESGVEKLLVNETLNPINPKLTIEDYIRIQTCNDALKLYGKSPLTDEEIDFMLSNIE